MPGNPPAGSPRRIEDDGLPALASLCASCGVEDGQTAGGAGAGRQTGRRSGVGGRVDRGMEQLVELVGLDAADGGGGVDQPLVDHVARRSRTAARPVRLAGPRLEHPEPAPLDRELEVLHVVEVRSSRAATAAVPSYAAASSGLVGHRRRAAAVSGCRRPRLRPGRWAGTRRKSRRAAVRVAGEGHPVAQSSPRLPKTIAWTVTAVPRSSGMPNCAAVGDGARGVPGPKDGHDRSRSAGEGSRLARRLTSAGEVLDGRRQVARRGRSVAGQAAVEAAGLGELALGEAEDDSCRTSGSSGGRSPRRSARRCARRSRDGPSSSPRLRTVSIIPGIETAAPERTETSSGQAGSPKRRSSAQFHSARPVATSSQSPSGTARRCRGRPAGLGGDGESGRDGQAEAGHLGQLGPLAAEQGGPAGNPIAKPEDPASHPLSSLVGMELAHPGRRFDLEQLNRQAGLRGPRANAPSVGAARAATSPPGRRSSAQFGRE